MPPRGVKKGTKRARQYEHVKRSEKQPGPLGAPRQGDRSPDGAKGARALAASRASARGRSTRDISSGRRGGLRSGRPGPRGQTREQLYNEAKRLNIQRPLTDEQAPAPGGGQPQEGRLMLHRAVRLPRIQAGLAPLDSLAAGSGPLAPARRRRPQLLVLDLALELAQRAPQMAAQLRRGDQLGDPSGDAGRRRPHRRSGTRPSCGRRRSSRRRQRPRWSTPMTELHAMSRSSFHSTISISPPTSADPTRISIR